MISTKWIQGVNLEEVFKIRSLVFGNELNFDNSYIHDDFDGFGKNVLLYDSEKPVGTGRLIFKDGKYIIDKICVLKEFRNNSYGELIIRMLVRKAFDIGADKTYVSVEQKFQKLFEKIGFIVDSNLEDKLIMIKYGDVGGHCCGGSR